MMTAPTTVNLRPGRSVWALAILIGIAASLGIAAGTGFLAERCNCRYTAVIFAQRSGAEQIRLPIMVEPADREAFARDIEAAGALVDPDWRLGLLDGAPIVYVDPSRRAAVQSEVAKWRHSHPTIRIRD